MLLAESLAAAQRGGAVEEKHLRRVTIDTTVQPKAVTHPTDSKLLHRGIEILARLARRNGVRLRQSYLRVAKRARREAAKLIHSGRPRQAERQVRRLRTWLGRLFRDIGRKIAGNAAAEAAFAGPLGLIARLLRQRREDRGRDKLYSLHAPEVECIGKGKAHARFEFGVKVSIATTNAARAGRAVRPRRPRPAGQPLRRPHPGRADRPDRAHHRRRDRARLCRPRLPRPRRRPRPRHPRRPEARHHADHPPRAAAAQRHRARHRPHEERRPPRPQLPARHRGRRRQRSSSPRQATTSACSAPGWPGSWRSCSACSRHPSNRRRPSAAAAGRLKAT